MHGWRGKETGSKPAHICPPDFLQRWQEHEERMTFLCWESCVFTQNKNRHPHLKREIWDLKLFRDNRKYRKTLERAIFFLDKIPKALETKAKMGYVTLEASTVPAIISMKRWPTEWRRQARAGAVINSRKAWRMVDLLVPSHVKRRGRSSYTLLRNRVARRNNCELSRWNDKCTCTAYAWHPINPDHYITLYTILKK